MRQPIRRPHTILFALLCVVVSLATGCSIETGGPDRADPAARSTAPDDDPPALRVVRGMADAFNAHDVEELIAHTAPDVQWLGIDGVAVAVETDGHDALRESMTGYFAALPSVRSEIEDAMVSGNYVTVTERAHWEGKDGRPRSQAALAVYEVRDDLVRRVWYFPATQ